MFGLLQIKLWKVACSPEESFHGLNSKESRELREKARKREIVLKAILLENAARDKL